MPHGPSELDNRTEHEWDISKQKLLFKRQCLLVVKNKRSGVGQACASVPAVSVT